LPSPRRYHTACVNEGLIYILGGRDQDDLRDLHTFDLENLKWEKIEVSPESLKPRRNHSAVFIGSSLIMFGGYHDKSQNDLCVLHLCAGKKSKTTHEEKTIDSNRMM
jgi:hypothetical protein